jgi:hypothetical protein
MYSYINCLMIVLYDRSSVLSLGVVLPFKTTYAFHVSAMGATAPNSYVGREGPANI